MLVHEFYSQAFARCALIILMVSILMPPTAYSLHQSAGGFVYLVVRCCSMCTLQLCVISILDFTALFHGIVRLKWLETIILLVDAVLSTSVCSSHLFLLHWLHLYSE
jgi:hypothetical protein